MEFVFARIGRSTGGKRRFGSTFWPVLSALLFAAVLPLPVFANEPAEEFVKGLQSRGLHDFALEYLEQLKTSPLADDAVRRKVPYLRGVALIEQSRQASDVAARNKLLDEARQELVQFAESNPQSVQGAEAQLQLASVQMSRGQDLVLQQSQLPKDAAYDAQRRSLGREARTMFAEARDTYGRAEGIFSAELEKLPPTTSAEARGDTGSKRQEYRGRVAQIRFLIAEMQYEEAQSYPPDAEEFRKLNETAAQELSAIYDEFARTMPVGLYARLYEGRCYQALGSYQLALGCFEEIIGKDNVLPVLRKLSASATQRKAEVLIAQEKLDVAIEACKLCLKGAHKDETNQPEWVGVRFRLAEALVKKGESLPAEAVEHRRDIAEARDAYKAVAKVPGEYQMAARAAAAAVAGGGKSSGEKEKEEPKTFQAAYDLGKEALTSYNTAKMAIPSAEKNNPPAVQELRDDMERNKEEARHYFKSAAALVADDTDPKLVNEVRYFLCWFYWEAEDYFRAAVLGEFIAQRYPDHPDARSAAKIAMASFERLYNQAVMRGGKNGGEFEARRMAEMAQLITRRWSGSEDANAAFSVLVGVAIRNGRIEDAEKLVSEATAASRPRLELQLGNAMWARYLELSLSGQTPPPDEAALAKLKESAVKYLRTGLDAARKESSVGELVPWAALNLVQSLLSDGKYTEAISLLEDNKIGPLTLIANKHASASRPQFEMDAYKAALRAYVSISPPQEAKAFTTMQSLERVVQASGDAAASADQLNRIYVGMGMALQKQIDELRAAGKEREAIRVAGAVAKFLDRINSQPGTANWPTRVWLAQTYYAMATNQQPGSQQPASASGAPFGAKAKDYLTKSRDTYQQLLKEAAENPKLPPSDKAVLAAKIQLGECYRALGEYQEALDLFAEVLKTNETTLDVQRAAALAFQDRGQNEDPKFFEQAIHGGYKQAATNKNRVWGWLKIADATARASRGNEKFRDSFYEARFHIAQCRYLAGLKKTGEARRTDLANAEKIVRSFAQVYPDMGGERWKPKFEQLLKDIEYEQKSFQSNTIPEKTEP